MEPPEPGGGAFTPIRDSNLSQIEERGDILVTNFCAAVDGVLDTNASKAVVVKISISPQVFCSQDKKKNKTIIAVGRKDTASFAIIEDFTLVNPCALPLSIQLLLWTWSPRRSGPGEEIADDLSKGNFSNLHGIARMKVGPSYIPRTLCVWL